MIFAREYSNYDIATADAAITTDSIVTCIVITFPQVDRIVRTRFQVADVILNV